MKINNKTGILLAMLAMPVFIWLFLKFFGQSHYSVPLFYESGITVEGCPQEGDAVHNIPDFSLNQINGQALTQTGLDDHLTVVHFFSYPCDTACINLMEAFARIQHVFENDSTVQLLSIEDTGKNIQKFADLAETYRAISDKWYYLGGENQFVETLKRCGFVLHEHTGIQYPVILLDTERRIRGYYAGTDDEDIDRLIGEIRILLYNLKQENA